MFSAGAHGNGTLQVTPRALDAGRNDVPLVGTGQKPVGRLTVTVERVALPLTPSVVCPPGVQWAG